MFDISVMMKSPIAPQVAQISSHRHPPYIHRLDPFCDGNKCLVVHLISDSFGRQERRVGTGHWSEAEARSNCVVIDDGGADGSRIVSRMQNPPRDKMNGGIF